MSKKNICFKNVAILGDSYSTFEGYIPQGYAVYYSKDRNDGCDVKQVENTWWQILCNGTNSNLVTNNSFSGSAIARISYNKEYSLKSSFTFRLQNDFDFSKIDTLFIFGGTNDFWAGSPIGQVCYEGFDEQVLNNTLPSFCFMLDYLSKNAPNTKVINVVNCELSNEITNGMVTACNHYGVDCILLKDIEKINGHPNIKGMNEIANQIIKFYN